MTPRFSATNMPLPSGAKTIDMGWSRPANTTSSWNPAGTVAPLSARTGAAVTNGSRAASRLNIPTARRGRRAGDMAVELPRRDRAGERRSGRARTGGAQPALGQRPGDPVQHAVRARLPDRSGGDRRLQV